MPDKHASLGPSKAHQWINCPPSIRLEEKFPDRQTNEASEGTLAHKMAEELLRYNNHEITKTTYTRRLNKLKEDPQYNPAMQEYVEGYASFVWEQANTAKKSCPDPLILFEQELHFEDYVPDGFGTSDVVIIADDTAHVIDFKYGKGVGVSAINNPQLRLYALGAYLEFSDLYDIKRVKMTIVQPRLDNISTDEISAEDLLTWADEVVRPAANLALQGDGTQCVGDHCRWCKAKATCRAQKEYQLQMAAYDFADPPLLDEDEIADVLQRVDELVKWAGQVKDYALQQALENHMHFPGFKLVEGRSVRKYTDQVQIGLILTNAGFGGDQIYKPMELIGITDMEKLLGKKRFAELIGPLTVKPEGKPTLVPESDKRPELNTAEKADSEFQDAELDCMDEMLEYKHAHDGDMGALAYWKARLNGKIPNDIIEKCFYELGRN